MAMRYAVNKETGARRSFAAGSGYDKERTQSKDWKVFNDSSKASEYARKIKK